MNFPPHRKAKRARARGFTIIEIMTAMMIFGMIVAAIFATWTALAHGSQSGNRAAATAQRSRVALRTIEDALGATRSFVADVQYYTFVAENGALCLRRRKYGTIPLTPTFADAFVDPNFETDFLFARDANAAVTGVKISSGRIRDLSFVRKS